MSALTQNIVSRLRLNPDSPFAKGLVGCWLMGNRACWRSNKLLDLSPYNNHGVLTNMDPAADWVHDGERAGLDFDGSNDHIDCGSGNPLDLVDEFTISSWAWISDNKLFLLCKGDGTSYQYSLYSDSSRRLSFFYGNNLKVSSSTGVTPPVDAWVHVAVVIAGGTVSFFVNGSFDSAPAISSLISRTSPLYLGARKNGTSVNFVLNNSKLDAVLIHNRALTAAEVAQLYNETKNGSYGSLVRRRRRRVLSVGAGGGIVFAVGQASETDVAQSIAKSKLKQIGQSTESDAAQILSASKSRLLGLSSESDISNALSLLKSRTLGLSLEADSATGLLILKAKAITQAVETDQAFNADPVTGIPVGQAIETDSAFVLDWSKQKAIGLATEIDTSQSVNALKELTIGQPAETDQAFGVAIERAVTTGVATETDQANTLSLTKTILVGLAVETDTALNLLGISTTVAYIALGGCCVETSGVRGAINTAKPRSTIEPNTSGGSIQS